MCVCATGLASIWRGRSTVRYFHFHQSLHFLLTQLCVCHSQTWYQLQLVRLHVRLNDDELRLKTSGIDGAVSLVLRFGKRLTFVDALCVSATPSNSYLPSYKLNVIFSIAAWERNFYVIGGVIWAWLLNMAFCFVGQLLS